MSADLVWDIIKHNHAFLVKQGPFTFSCDPYNNTGRNTFSSNGLIQHKAVGISGGSKATDFDVHFRKRGRYQQKSHDPAKAGKNVNQKAKQSLFATHLPVSHGVHKVAKVIQKRFGNASGRGKAALRKLYVLHRAQIRRALNQRKE